MKAKLKICGMRNTENIQVVSELKPDYMGFIFYPDSPRFVGDNFKLPKIISHTIMKVGVFVNAPVKEIEKKIRQHNFDFIQLHGSESPDQVMELKDQGIKVIKAFSVDEVFDFKSTKPYYDHVDYLLFDTKGKRYGGNAAAFDWRLMKKYDQAVPFFLSGGLSPSNIDQLLVLNGMNLHALDLNSGVEESPGIKSIDKIRQVMEAIGH